MNLDVKHNENNEKSTSTSRQVIDRERCTLSPISIKEKENIDFSNGSEDFSSDDSVKDPSYKDINTPSTKYRKKYKNISKNIESQEVPTDLLYEPKSNEQYPSNNKNNSLDLNNDAFNITPNVVNQPTPVQVIPNPAESSSNSSSSSSNSSSSSDSDSSSESELTSNEKNPSRLNSSGPDAS